MREERYTDEVVTRTRIQRALYTNEEISRRLFVSAGFSNLHIDLPLGPSKSNLIDPIKLVETLVGSETVHQENRVRKLNEGTHHRFKEAGVFEGVFRKRWDWAGDRSEIIWRRVEDLGEGGLEGEGEDRLKLDFDVRVGE